MKKVGKDIHPPRWAERLLAWYCKPELLEDLQGDLNEFFQRNVIAKGARRARVNYVLDVFKFFRFYTVRKPQFINLLIQWIMIGSYIKTSTRSISRNKLFSAINIVGLAISMSVGLLIITFLSDLMSYDDFHINKDRIYRITNQNKYLEELGQLFASSSIVAGRKIREQVTGVDDLTITRRSFDGDGKIGTSAVPISGLYADDHFFKVFTFPVLYGNPSTALKDPYSIVLTEKSAKKLFGTEEAFGKVIRFDTIDYKVTAVMKDIPNFSHLNFEVLVSLSTLEALKPNDKMFTSWESMWQSYVYLLLPKNPDLKLLESNLTKLSIEQNKTIHNRKIFLGLQPLKKIALGPDLSNQAGRTMPISIVWILGGLSLVVIFSACFNYTNLSIARAFHRTREVGIRKVVGAMKKQVLTQFVVEAVIISLMALVISTGLFILLRPGFLSLAPEMDEMINLEISPMVIVYFVIFAMCVGIIAGFLPALFFSKLNAMQVLKGNTSVKAFRKLSLRRVLIVGQYTISLIFITTTILGYNQYKGFLAIDLGFTTANILNIRMQGNKPGQIQKELSEIPEISAMSRSGLVSNLGSYVGDYYKYNNPLDSAMIWINTVDENYLPLHKHKLIAGRNFKPKTEDAVDDEVILNEAALKRFGMDMKNPSSAIGEFITNEGKKFQVVGVMKDFLYGKAENKIEPVIFRYMINGDGYINANVTTTDWPSTLARIEKAWKKIDPIHPLNAKFYNEQIEQAYHEFSAMLKVLGFLAFLAICISAMGLFGMVVFSTETRLKEISIRKVLGASERKLIYLLSKGFLVMLTFSALIALPATYLLFDQVILPNFAHHKPIGFQETMVGFAVVMLLAFIMIGSQTLKVARSNPATVLKNE